MKFTTDSNELFQAAAIAASISERGGDNPNLHNILIEATDSGYVTLSATDLQVSIRWAIMANVEEVGGICVNAKRLVNILRTFPQGPIAMASESYRMEISGEMSEFRLEGFRPSMFVRLPTGEDMQFMEVDTAPMLSIIHHVLFSTPTEGPANLRGAFYECDGSTATGVSTDGHRMTVYKTNFRAPRTLPGVTIPRKGLSEIRRLLSDAFDGKCNISFSESHLFIRGVAPRIELAVKLITGPFVPYERIIPERLTNRVTVSRADLSGAIDRVLAIIDGVPSMVMSTSHEYVTLESLNATSGRSTQRVHADYSGESVSVGINARYLLEAVDAIYDAEMVTIDLNDGLAPVVVKPAGSDNFVCVIMPHRL